MAARELHWTELLAEGCGAVALGGGAGASAWLLAPMIGLAPVAPAIIASLAGGLGGWAVVRAVPGSADQVLIASSSIRARAALPSAESEGSTEMPRIVERVSDGPPIASGERAAPMAGGPLPDSVRSIDSPTRRAVLPATPDASASLHAALADLRLALRAG